MVYIFLAGACLAAVYFCMRFLLLKRAVRQAAGELREITADLEENRGGKAGSAPERTGAAADGN